MNGVFQVESFAAWLVNPSGRFVMIFRMSSQISY